MGGELNNAKKGVLNDHQLRKLLPVLESQKYIGMTLCLNYVAVIFLH